jgi:hypothetical protein
MTLPQFLIIIAVLILVVNNYPVIKKLFVKKNP